MNLLLQRKMGLLPEKDLPRCRRCNEIFVSWQGDKFARLCIECRHAGVEDRGPRELRTHDWSRAFPTGFWRR